MRAPELYGLVLTGGQSRRMGTDKAMLKVGDRTQLDVCHDLLDAVCAKVWISARPEQARGDYPVIHDRYGHIGPIDGILSALDTHPDHAWLVIACDMPHLDAATLHHLIAHRDPTRPATAFRNPEDGRPEPLCAIYAPAMRLILLAGLEHGITSPRDILTSCGPRLLDASSPQALENINAAPDRLPTQTPHNDRR